MRSTFYGLEIAKSGLFGAQNAMQVTGHNISNVDTPGYTRQRLNTSSVPPSYGGTLIGIDNRSTAGRGVTTINIERVRNTFLDYQYRKENTQTTQLQVKEQYFEYVEQIFNNELDDIVTSTGMTKMFSQFYDAIYELSEKPESTEMRVNLQQKALTLAESFNYYSQRLQEQQATLNETVRITVNEINSISNKIANLNKQIYGYEQSGATANDLRDERDNLLDTLSGLVNITTYEDTDGQLVVTVGEGETAHVLIRHKDVNEMTVHEEKNGLMNGESKYTPVWADVNGDPTFAKVDIDAGGALKGYVEIRDGATNEDIGIPYVVEQLNNIVRTLAKDMNAVHQSGWTFPSTAGGESVTGVDFFNVPTLVKLVDADGNAILDKNGDEVWYSNTYKGVHASRDDMGNTIYVDQDDNIVPIASFDENNQPDPYSVITADNFRLSDAVLSDVFNIATSSEKIVNGADNNQKGNNENILAMAGIITKTDAAGNPANVDSMFKSLLNDISIEMDYIHTNYKAQNVMLAHLDTQRASISDVSLDEEMTNVIRFGHAYNAASRVISAIDEELDKLINGTGRVGL
ncbi:MAG: flagellar hook-associated protein FlgK [Clostridia bacterium]|nr:flagellar hook-associated protein FlgK [Clostridia bacterium]